MALASLGALAAAAGCADSKLRRPPDTPRAAFGIHLATEDPEGAIVVEGLSGELRVELAGGSLVTVEDILDVALTRHEGRCSLAIWLSAEAGLRLEEVSETRAEARLAILIDGRAVAAPMFSGSLGRAIALDLGGSCDDVSSVGESLAP